MCMIEMLGMCGIRQPSCLSLVASLMGKCSLVLPLSHGSLYSLVYRSPASPVTTAPEHLDWPECDPLRSCVCPFGKCHAVTSGVLLACYSPGSRSPVSQFYSPDSRADDRHIRCCFMYACPRKLVPLWVHN